MTVHFGPPEPADFVRTLQHPRVYEGRDPEIVTPPEIIEIFNAIEDPEERLNHALLLLFESLASENPAIDPELFTTIAVATISDLGFGKS